MNFLVTGGCGFIGSNFVDYLLKEIDKNDVIYVIDNLSTGKIEYLNKDERVILLEYDIRNYEKIYQILKEIKPICIWHFAAWPRIQPSFESPVEHEDTNVVGSLNIIEAVTKLKLNTKIIYSSSSSVYGDNYPSSVLNSKIDPMNPYAVQKYASERMLLQIGERFNIPVVALRYFNVYGKRSFNPENKFSAYSSVIGIFIDENENNKPLDITGDGLQKRDFVHVYDIAGANYAAFKNNVTGVFNIGSGKNISILDLAKIISDNIIFIPERKNEAKETLAADLNYTEQHLKWRPLIDLDYGIRNYYTL